MRRSLALLAAAACLTSCGSPTRPPAPSSQADRLWIDNEAGVIDQLQHDLVLGAIGGVQSARAALRNGLYTPLVAFTDFGGCNEMQRSAGDPPARFVGVVRAMDAACGLLQRAASQFTQAASTNDASRLVEAGRTASRASPYLERANLLLHAAIATRKS